MPRPHDHFDIGAAACGAWEIVCLISSSGNGEEYGRDGRGWEAMFKWGPAGALSISIGNGSLGCRSPPTTGLGKGRRERVLPWNSSLHFDDLDLHLHQVDPSISTFPGAGEGGLRLSRCDGWKRKKPADERQGRRLGCDWTCMNIVRVKIAASCQIRGPKTIPRLLHVSDSEISVHGQCVWMHGDMET